MAERTLTLRSTRRLAVARQHLAGPRPPAPGVEDIMRVARDLGCLQLDPISVVARSHQLVLASRLGPYDLRDLDRILWEDRALFEYWAHVASIVLTEDFPIHSHMMRGYGKGTLQRHETLREWVRDNARLRRSIVQQIRRRGPLRSRDIVDTAERAWRSGGWNSGRSVNQMLDYLWTKGTVAVAGRQGIEKVWELASRWFPSWTPRERLTPRQVTRRAAQRSLRALGVATPRQIQRHFTLHRYPDLDVVLLGLEREGLVVPARIVHDGASFPGRWLVHAEDLDLLDAIERGDWEPRTALLSPFDNLIYDRERAAMLFGFDFRMEIYVPKHLRRHGYYTMPVVHGDRIVAVTDPAFDRATGTLRVRAVHLEPGAPKGLARPIRGAIEDLASFLGADRVEMPPRRAG